MVKARLTTIHQAEVEIIKRDKITDPEELKSYDYNNPGKMTGGKWELIKYPDGTTLWHPVQSYTFSTPEIKDHGRVELKANQI